MSRKPDFLDAFFLVIIVLCAITVFGICKSEAEACNCGGLHDFLSQDEVLSLASAYHDWVPYEVDAVVYCESRRDRFAYNPKGYYGLSQVSARWHLWRVGGDVSRLYEAEEALRVMHDIYVEAGRTYTPWPVCGRL